MCERVSRHGVHSTAGHRMMASRRHRHAVTAPQAIACRGGMTRMSRSRSTTGPRARRTFIHSTREPDPPAITRASLPPHPPPTPRAPKKEKPPGSSYLGCSGYVIPQLLCHGVARSAIVDASSRGGGGASSPSSGGASSRSGGAPPVYAAVVVEGAVGGAPLVVDVELEAHLQTVTDRYTQTVTDRYTQTVTHRPLHGISVARRRR